MGLMYTQRSEAYLARSLPDEAIQDAELALVASPDLGKAYAARAGVLLDLFKNKEALTDLDKAEELLPSLTSTLAEQRLRAQGKKWVHNCYLKKRRRLMNHHKCDFVIIIPGKDGEDDVIEPWHGKQDAQRARTLLVQPEASGTQTEGLLPEFCHLLRDTNLRGRVGAQRFAELLHEQLQREFGPDKKFQNRFKLSASHFKDTPRLILPKWINDLNEQGQTSVRFACPAEDFYRERTSVIGSGQASTQKCGVVPRESQTVDTSSVTQISSPQARTAGGGTGAASTFPQWLLPLDVDDDIRCILLQNRIDERSFNLLDSDDLKELGVPFGPRKVLLKEIAKQKKA